MKVVVIGGVAAGMSAASKIRRMDKNAKIVVFEKGIETSYGACGLPYYISGVNNNIDLMRIRKPEEFIEKQNIDVRLLNEVINIDIDEKKVKVKDLKNNKIFYEEYEKLVIATGSSPIVPRIEGLDKNIENVFTVKTLEDGEKIKKYLSNTKVKNVAIAGAGYIGLEMVEACQELGKNTTLIELQDNLLASVDSEIGDIIKKELENNNINIKLSEKIISLNTEKNIIKSVNTDKNTYNVDALILATGVRPNTSFSKNTSILLNERGAILVNNKMETSVPNIYAGGDCAVVYHKILGENSYIPLGTNANKQGKIIGENIMGANKSYPGSIGTAAIKILDLEVGRTGISEKEAERYEINYSSVFVKAPAHAPYYPGNTDIFIKLIYDKDYKKILGAQLAGKQGIALRTDMFAIMIDAEYTADKIMNLDLCYAPPFSYVWDAVQIAAGQIK